MSKSPRAPWKRRLSVDGIHGPDGQLLAVAMPGAHTDVILASPRMLEVLKAVHEAGECTDRIHKLVSETIKLAEGKKR